MNVAIFIKSRNDYWKELEDLLAKLRSGTALSRKEFKTLSHHYRAATSDYAYATTYFPGHDITQYLNKLVSEAHGIIYQRNRFKIGDAWEWLTFRVPSLFKEHIGSFLFALFTFTLFFWVGFLASEFTEDGEKMCLVFSITNPEGGMAAADRYINKTQKNIDAGKPFRVYEDDAQATMFSNILFNNVQVALLAFVGGIFFGVLTWFALARNGMMLGAFFHIFYRNDLSLEFANTVLIHGMIELTMIVMAGGAGFMIAKGLLFPGNYTRKDSLIKAGLDSVQLAVIISVWLIVAAFQESFLTAYVDPGVLERISVIESVNLSDVIKVSINIGSLAIMVFYFGALGTGMVEPRRSVGKVNWIAQLAVICFLILLPFGVLLLSPVVYLLITDYRLANTKGANGELKKTDWILVGLAGLAAPASLIFLTPIIVYSFIEDPQKKTQKIYNLLRKN